MRILNDDIPEVLRRNAAHEEADRKYRRLRADARFLEERLKDLKRENSAAYAAEDQRAKDAKVEALQAYLEAKERFKAAKREATKTRKAEQTAWSKRLRELRHKTKEAKALAYAAHLEALRLKREGHAYALECAARCPQPANPARAAAAPEEDPFA